MSLRLAVRHIDGESIAYLASGKSMAGAVRLGSIARGASEYRKRQWIALMQGLAADIELARTGNRPEWAEPQAARG